MDGIYELHKALGDESRFQIVKTLLAHDYCVGSLARRLDISTGAVSQHLQILRKVGIVRGEKRGYWTHYQVDKDKLLMIARELEEMASFPQCTDSCDKNTGKCCSCQDEQKRVDLDA